MKGKPTLKVKTDSTTYWNEFHYVMMRKVTGFALDPINLPVTGTVPAFQTLMTGLDAKLDLIASLKAIVSNPITGFAEQKAAARQSLIDLSVDIMNTTYGFAYTTGNPILKQQSAISASELDGMKYSEMLSRTQVGIDTVSPYATDGSLAPYNITPASIAAWQAIKDQAELTLTNPQGAIANRESLNVNIQSLMLEGMIAITNVADTIIYQFRAPNLNYFNEYWANRVLNEHHVSTQGRFTVKYYSGAPVTVGEIYILGTDRSNTLNSDGYALVDHIPFGKHQVTLSLATGDHTYGPFDFKKGKSLSLFFTISDPTVAPTVKVTEKDIEEVRK